MRYNIFEKTVLLAACIFLFMASIKAEKAPMKFGKVDPADLEMKVYAPDSSAAAVVLCDYGYFDPQLFQFVHQIRIKILKEEGKFRGDFFVPAAEKTVVKGQTVNLENGIPVITKLNKESIFIERIVKGFYRARVAMPNVKVGSVLDVEFYFEGYPTRWDFQQTIPVRWSEYQESNPYISLIRKFVGYHPLSISTEGRWVAKNVPAFKSESKINNAENYMTHFDIELAGINIVGYHLFFTTSWDGTAEYLRTHNEFGMLLRDFNFFLNGTEKAIKALNLTPEEQMIKAYEAIKRIKWDKNETIWPSVIGLDQVYSKKTGNAADINLNLIILLHKLDIEAYPVLISTRRNGLLTPGFVSLWKTNYVIVQAVIGDKTFLLDATEDNLPAGMLAERAINGQGFVIKKSTQEWIDLSTQKKDKTVALMNLKLTPDGVIKGDWSRTSTDYAAFKQRNLYKTFNNQDEYLKSIESSNLGLSIENYQLKGIDSIQQPLKEDFGIVLKKRVIKTNHQLIINTILFDKITENPFKLELRQYPVDFVTPSEKTQVLRLEIPEGYEVEQMPKDIKMNLPGNTASFQMQSSINGNVIQILFKLAINKAIFNQPEYPDLKAFFNELVKKQSEMLIIRPTKLSI